VEIPHQSAAIDLPTMARTGGINAVVTPLLRDGETIEAQLSGLFGALPSGGYAETPRPLLGSNSTFDPFDVVMTTQRLLAFPDDAPVHRAFVIESERSSAHVTVVRRLGLYAWASFVLHDREVRLLVSRRYRAALAQMARALP
jgi:hypothetical protein